MAALESRMLDVLRAEGHKDLEFLVVTQGGVFWEYHAAGYDQVRFPIMSDTSGVFYVYGAVPYDVFLVDSKGRLVTRYANYSDGLEATVLQRLRQLLAE